MAKLRFAFFLLIISGSILFIGVGKANAATYYVANAGNDACDGTSSAIGSSGNCAWQTIAHVNVQTFQPGDSILFNRGDTWREELRVIWSGTSGNPITFGAYGNSSLSLPTLDGGTIINSNSWVGPDGNGVYTYTYSGQINAFSEDGLIPTYASGASLTDGNWYLSVSGGTTTLYYKPTSGTPANHVTDRSTRAACISFDSTNNAYITIQDIHCFLSMGVYANAAVGSLHDIIVENSQFDHDITDGVVFNTRNGNENSNITITGNTVTNTSESIFVGSWANGPEMSRNITISNNIIQNTGLMNGTQSWKLIFPSDQEAIGLQNLANSTVSGNAISGGAPGGGISYWTNASTAGAVGNQFYNNYIHDILGFGIAPGGSGTSNSNVSVTYNIISRCGQGSSPPYGGLRLNRAQSGTSLIANNIVYGCDRGIYMYSLTDHYIIKNNIISGNSDYAVYRGEVGINSNILSSNIYYPDGSAEFYYMGSNENFSQWKNSTNQDSNSLSSNPLFTNASGSYSRASDFQLQSSSPAINAGTNIGLTSDYAGNPIVGSPDIGAYEYQGTIPSTPPSDTTPPAAPTGLSVN